MSGAVTGGAVPVLAAGRLSVGYGRKAVVEGIELELGRGATLALVGANGSGKSTLLKTMAGLLPALAGSMKVFGGRPGRNPSRVAYLGQFHSNQLMLPLRALDVVRMARYPTLGLMRRATAEDERMVREAMERMGIGGLAREPLSGLSGGQRQRVHIAQALARGAELLLLDEPEANLDAESKETLLSAVRAAVQAGGTVVIATHDIKEASRCDQAMLLAQRVVAYGPGCSVLTPDTLLSTFGVTARMEEGRVVVVEREHRHECGE